MINKLLPVLFTSLVGFTTSNSFNHSMNEVVDYNHPNYMLGDYEKTAPSEFGNGGGGQITYYRISVILPIQVFETLGQYENVYITIPNYQYNSAVPLTMRIDYYYGPDNFTPVLDPMGEIPLSASMLKAFPYTIVDLPSFDNIFNPNSWRDQLPDPLRLTFTIPFKAYSTPISTWRNDLDNITLFTQVNNSTAAAYDAGYDEGYREGDYDGYYRAMNEDFNAYSYLFGLFGAFSGFFAVELLPGLTIGGIAILVLTLTLLPFIIGLFTKGGKK